MIFLHVVYTCEYIAIMDPLLETLIILNNSKVRK